MDAKRSKEVKAREEAISLAKEDRGRFEAERNVRKGAKRAANRTEEQVCVCRVMFACFLMGFHSLTMLSSLFVFALYFVAFFPPFCDQRGGGQVLFDLLLSDAFIMCSVLFYCSEILRVAYLVV